MFCVFLSPHDVQNRMEQAHPIFISAPAVHVHEWLLRRQVPHSHSLLTPCTTTLRSRTVSNCRFYLASYPNEKEEIGQSIRVHSGRRRAISQPVCQTVVFSKGPPQRRRATPKREETRKIVCYFCGKLDGVGGWPRPPSSPSILLH